MFHPPRQWCADVRVVREQRCIHPGIVHARLERIDDRVIIGEVDRFVGIVLVRLDGNEILDAEVRRAELERFLSDEEHELPMHRCAHRPYGIGIPAAASFWRMTPFWGDTLLRRASAITRTGTPALKRLMSASAMTLSSISSNATSIFRPPR